MAWHMGHPLAQTIFTSLYIDKMLFPNPSDIEETYFDQSHGSAAEEPLLLRILRAYCLGLIKTCFYVKHRVEMENFYEVRMKGL
jgi:hypothetical protein